MVPVYIGTAPDGVQHRGSGSRMFYFGVKPYEVHLLPVGAEFSIVYTFRWKVVVYRILTNESGQRNMFAVVRQRPLKPDEIAYFEGIMAGV